ARDTGRLAEAETALRQVILSFRQGEYVLGLLDALALFAECATALGHHEDAAAAIAEAQERLSQGSDWGRLAGLVAVAEAVSLRAQGAVHDADLRFTDALDLFERLELWWDSARTRYLWGAGIQSPAAVERVQRAERTWREMGAERYASVCQRVL